MKLNLLIILSFFLFTSCNKDDDSNESTDNNFPVKLVFKNKIDELIFFKNGQKQEPTKDEINTFFKENEETLTEFDNAMNNDFFEFVNEELLTLNLTLDNSDEFTIPYTFTNSILNIRTFNNNYAPIADGSIDEIKRHLVIVFFNQGPGSGSHSTFGLLKDNEIFPLSFESTKVHHHDFESLDDIKENDNLYLFTREYIFKQ